MNAQPDVWSRIKPGCMAAMFRHPWRLLTATAAVASLAAGCSSSDDVASESANTSGPDVTSPVDTAVPDTAAPDNSTPDVSVPDTQTGDPTTTIAAVA